MLNQAHMYFVGRCFQQCKRQFNFTNRTTPSSTTMSMRHQYDRTHTNECMTRVRVSNMFGIQTRVRHGHGTFLEVSYFLDIRIGVSQFVACGLWTLHKDKGSIVPPNLRSY